MDVEHFCSRVYAYARAHGEPFIRNSDTDALRTFISERVQQFVSETMCLYDDEITMTLTASTGTYDLMSTSVFSSAILEPLNFFRDGVAMLGEDGYPGSVSSREADDWVYDYRTVADGPPQKWLLFPPSTVRLIPAPDVATYSVVASGWIQHFDLTASGVLDTTEMLLGTTALHPAAMYCAGHLVIGAGEGPSQAAAIGMIEYGLKEGRKIAARADSMLQGPMVRGRRRQTRVALA